VEEVADTIVEMKDMMKDMKKGIEESLLDK
jgi:hypothetical protein